MPREDGWFKSGDDPRRAAKRREGAKTKLTTAFLEAFAADFEEHGKAVIVAARTEDPVQYLKIAASLLPKDVNLEVSNVTYDEAVRALLNGSGVESGDAEQPAETVN